MMALFKHISLLSLLIAFNVALGCKSAATAGSEPRTCAIDTYAEIVYQNYSDAHADAVKLQGAIQRFLKSPSEKSLNNTKKAWLQSRESYGTTEAFRFYEGPIDFADEVKGTEGPEGQLNAWPMNEAHLDYVKGNPKSGIIQDTSLPMTLETLLSKNASEDEADVTTGYHAIEFLLWGQDFYTDSAGKRSYEDYVAGDEIKDRRRKALSLMVDLLVDDLAGLVKEWAPGKENYRKTFVAQKKTHAIGRILTGIGTLSGFELASERIAVSLDSGDQEDEHSCFSDNTHRDIILNAEGVSIVYFGKYKSVSGPSMHGKIAEVDGDLAEKLAAQIKKSVELANKIQAPVDQILVADKGNPQRQNLEALVISLQSQAKMIKQAGEKLGAQVLISGE